MMKWREMKTCFHLIGFQVESAAAAAMNNCPKIANLIVGLNRGELAREERSNNVCAIFCDLAVFNQLLQRFGVGSCELPHCLVLTLELELSFASLFILTRFAPDIS